MDQSSPEDNECMQNDSNPRPFSSRPVVKLSVQVLETFNIINEKYYTKKQKEKKLNAEKYGLTLKKSHTSSENDNNYDVKNSERLIERYVVTPVNGMRSALIGKGSFGKVVSAWDEIEKEFVAIKIVKNKRSFFQQAQREIEILISLRNSDSRDWNIVEMKNHFVHEGHQCIVFELLRHNLYEVLQYTKFEGLNLKLVRILARQLLRTLYYLGSSVHGIHKRRILHCDLKPENILLRKPKKTKIKVIDFGSACFDDHMPHTYIQSRFYRSPEVLFGCPYSPAIDVFSLGCILFELRTGRPLFDGANEFEQVVKHVEVLGMPSVSVLDTGTKINKYFFFNVAQQKWEFLHKTMLTKDKTIEGMLGKAYDANDKETIQFVNLMKTMLTVDADARISPAEALQHPFFTEFSSSNDNNTNTNNVQTTTTTTSSSSSSDIKSITATTVNIYNNNNNNEEENVIKEEKCDIQTQTTDSLYSSADESDLHERKPNNSVHRRSRSQPILSMKKEENRRRSPKRHLQSESDNNMCDHYKRSRQTPITRTSDLSQYSVDEEDLKVYSSSSSIINNE